jgi:hypothetical protein
LRKTLLLRRALPDRDPLGLQPGGIEPAREVHI